LRTVLSPALDIAPRLTFASPPATIPTVDRLTYYQVLEDGIETGLLDMHEVGRIRAVIATWAESHPLAQQLAWYTVQMCVDIRGQTTVSAD
jgi:hypothetical protein